MKATAFRGETNVLRTASTSLLLMAATLAVFWQAGGHGFVDYDDGRYITENPSVAHGLTSEGIMWAFTATHAGNWHPITWVSHMSDVTLYGMNPRGHHLTNVVFHGVNAVLLFLLLNRLTGACWRSSFVAALFALHPLHVESVAWAAERKDVLSTMFWLLTLTAYVRYTEKPVRWRYFLALGVFVLGLMSKPMLVTLPFTLLLLDFWPLGRFKYTSAPPLSAGQAGSTPRGGEVSLNSHPLRGGPAGRLVFSSSSGGPGSEPRNALMALVMEKLPFIAFSVISAMVTVYSQYEGGAVSSLETLPLFSRIINALAAYVVYIWKMFWPLHLAVIYPLPASDSMMKGASAGLILAGLTFAIIRMAWKYPFLLMGWLWYLVTLVPVIGLFQVGIQSMADRYTYVPLIGLFIMISWGAPIISGQGRHGRLALSAAAVLAVLACAAVTWHQLGYWQNSVTLFRHAMEAVPDNDIAHVRLGYALARSGRPDEAIVQYGEALRIRPRDKEAYFNLGFVLMEQGRIPEAVYHYEEVLKTDPAHEGAHINLGNIFAERGRSGEALYHYSGALRSNPGNAETHFSMGLLLAAGGDLDRGAGHLAEALRIRPDFAEAHYNLGVVLAREGKPGEGIGHFNEALRIDPGLKEARLALEAALKRVRENRSPGQKRAGMSEGSLAKAGGK